MSGILVPRPFAARPYQGLIIDHILEHPRCAIWAGMGMGKTSSTLTAVDAMLLASIGPVLVLAPKRVAGNTWPQETVKWEHLEGLRCSVITGSEAHKRAALQRKADIYLTNYEQIPWLAEQFKRWPFRVIIADESTKLKGHRLRQGGKRAQALAKVAFEATHFIELTGTPSPNGLIDLWGQIWFLDRGERLGRTFQAFKDRWFRTHHSGFGYEAMPHAQAQIQDKLRDICLTVEAKDWFDLHTPIVNNIYVDLPARARKAYEELEEKMFTELDSGAEIEAFNAASRTIKCLHLANGACYTGEKNESFEEVHDEKIQALESIVEEAAGAPVLCSYHFKSDLARIEKAFPKVIDIATPTGLQRAQAGEGTLWVGHPASVGHGVDGLQEHCNQVAFFGHWWNLEERLQLIERVGPTRQAQAGKDRPVFIHNILASKTVDEEVVERHDTKREVQDILMAAMKRRKA